MKILFITNNLSGKDGWSRYSKDLVEGIKELNEIPICLVAKKSESKIKQYLVLEEPQKYLFNPFKSWKAAQEVNKIISDFSPDIIHFLVEPYVALLPFLKINKSKILLTVHGTYSYIPNLLSGLVKLLGKVFFEWVYNRLTKIIAVSNYTKNYFTSYYNRNKEKIEVLSNGISLTHFSYEPKEKRNDVQEILFVGAIKPRKGIKEALNALKFYKEKFSKNFIYRIVGKYDLGNPYYKELAGLIEKNNLSENVVWAGQTTDAELLNYYRHADLFLMLPIKEKFQFEGFGLVYLEANSQGTPVIGSKGCGAEDAIIDGQTGFLVDPYNSFLIAEKINLVLNGNIIASEVCRRHALENNIDRKIEKLLKIYRSY